MESHRYLSLLSVVFMFFLCSSQAYMFYVGGKDGWVLNPSENFNHWAERNRFQVNDTLIFKYKKGSDSVLVINQEDYEKCNTTKPIKSMADGDSMFIFDRSGPFFFISGNPGNCEKGQKLIVVVLAVRHKYPGAPAPRTSPSSSPPSPSPKAQAPGASPPKAITPSSPSPMASTPISPSPIATTPARSPSPVPTAKTPARAPSPAVTPSPKAATPVSSPSASLAPVPSSSPSPTSDISSPPASAPSSSSPSASTAPVPSSSPSPTSDITSPPAPAPSSSLAVTSSIAFVSGVSLVVTVILGSF